MIFLDSEEKLADSYMIIGKAADMDELLQRALDRRAQLRRELASLETFITSYSEVKEEQVPRREGQRDLFDRLKPVGFRQSRAVANDAAMEAAERIILSAGRPLSRSELLGKLEADGHVIVGGDKSKVLGTNLWRAKRFYNLKGAGYWPISEPIPEPFRHLASRESMLLSNKRK